MPHTLLAELPNRKLTVLHNGVKVATWEDASFGDNVFFGISMPFGANIEPTMKEGLAHYAEHAIVNKALATAVANTGGAFNALTAVDRTEFFGATMAEDFGGLFWQYAQMLKYPNFGPVHLQHEKKRVLAEIKEHAYTPQAIMLQLAILGDHPDRRIVRGLPSVVESLTAQDVRAHWQRLVQPQNITIALSGKIEHEDAVALADNCFGDMLRSQPPLIAPAGFTPHVHCDVTNETRTRMTVIFKSLAHDHPMARNVSILTHFLAEQQDLSLEYDLTHRRGLVYSSWAQLGDTNAYRTVGLGCDFDAPAARDIADSVAKHTYDMPDRITETHMQLANKRLRFLAGCEERSLSSYRNLLLDTAPDGKLPKTRQEIYLETEAPTLAEVKEMAAITFRDTPPAVAVSGAGAWPVINRLRPAQQ